MTTHLLTVPAAALALVIVGTSGAVADRLITGADVKDGSLQAKDLSALAQGKLRGQRGPAGATGPAGPGATSLYFDLSSEGTTKSVTLPDGTVATAECTFEGGSSGHLLSASLGMDQSSYTIMHGRVYRNDSSPSPRGGPNGEQAVDFAGPGGVGFGIEGFAPNTAEVAPNLATYEVLMHYGTSTVSLNLSIYLDERNCQINAQFVSSTDG